jgi:hypothetical protein
MAISGRKSMVNRHPGIPPETDLPRHPGHPGTESTDHPGGEREIPGTARVIVKKQDTKKIVLYKKRDRGHDNDTPPAPQTGESLSGQKGADSKGQADEAASQTRTDDTIDTWIRQVSSLPKAGSAESEEVIIRNMQKTPSDEALLHTDLRRERISEKKEAIEGTGATELLKEPGSVQKKQDIKRSDNDIMWVD